MWKLDPAFAHPAAAVWAVVAVSLWAGPAAAAVAAACGGAGWSSPFAEHLKCGWWTPRRYQLLHSKACCGREDGAVARIALPGHCTAAASPALPTNTTCSCTNIHITERGTQHRQLVSSQQARRPAYSSAWLQSANVTGIPVSHMMHDHVDEPGGRRPRLEMATCTTGTGYWNSVLVPLGATQSW